MDIDKLEAGRELDALVAEKVMGWKPWPIQIGTREHTYYFNADGFVDGAMIHLFDDEYLWDGPDFSKDIAAAWQVVERLVNEGFCTGLLFDDNGHWALVNDGMQNVPIGDEPEYIATTFFVEKELWCDTAPLAICRAALKAVGFEQEGER